MYDTKNNLTIWWPREACAWTLDFAFKNVFHRKLKKWNILRNLPHISNFNTNRLHFMLQFILQLVIIVFIGTFLLKIIKQTMIFTILRFFRIWGTSNTFSRSCNSILLGSCLKCDTCGAVALHHDLCSTPIPGHQHPV